ncbi:PDR/VanB family oxidoreductase [Gordonia sp. VNK21]|uniref:PDR/VanB family oxidoreductase n=1 Tax=Gordonia sp. VNK21 TaxID=3382483 RepID=UPI0038D3F4EF
MSTSLTESPAARPVTRPPDTLTLTVTAIAQSAPAIRSFTLAAPDGAALPGFVPGSHLTVQAGAVANAYSLTGDGIRPTEYTISVLRLPDGSGGSRYLHDEVRVGDELSAELPRSAFAPVGVATKYLLVAGGIGVTPILSHLRSARRWGRAVQVLYTFRAGQAAHIDDVVELSGPAAELFDEQQAFTERLAQALHEQPIGTHLYVCGPGPMMDHVVGAAEQAGWPPSRIHLERFGAGHLDDGEPFTVSLSESGGTVQVPAGTSMLEALEEHGVSVPSLCRKGVCGRCRTPLLGGAAVHRDLYLTDAEKAAGEAIMPCVSRGERDCTLEVSL